MVEHLSDRYEKDELFHIALVPKHLFGMFCPDLSQSEKSGNC